MTNKVNGMLVEDITAYISSENLADFFKLLMRKLGEIIFPIMVNENSVKGLEANEIMKSIKKLKGCLYSFLSCNLSAKIRFGIVKCVKMRTPFFQQVKLKFNIGSAGINKNFEWYPTDKESLDVTKENDWQKVLSFLQLDNIAAEHVWEHLTQKETELANANCFKYLKNGGVLRIAVPDGYNPNKKYIESVKPGGTGKGARDHKMLYNYKVITDCLQKAGFIVKPLEYWDEYGQFHYIDWDNEDGFIERSRRYDSRNKNGSLEYTSLIVDAMKP